jgi:hypothetical protein
MNIIFISSCIAWSGEVDDRRRAGGYGMRYDALASLVTEWTTHRTFRLHRARFTMQFCINTTKITLHWNQFDYSLSHKLWHESNYDGSILITCRLKKILRLFYLAQIVLVKISYLTRDYKFFLIKVIWENIFQVKCHQFKFAKNIAQALK